MEFKPTNPKNTKSKMRRKPRKTIEKAIKDIINYVGDDCNREGLQGTPDRIIRMFSEIFKGYDKKQKPKITTFSNEMHDSQLVIDSGDYYSLCEHHMMPFFGQYWFAYVPNPEGRILGLSKIARVVDYCSARLQLQERLCQDVVKMLMDALMEQDSEHLPVGMAIVMKGKHLCKSMRGARKDGTMTSTYFTGCFLEDSQVRRDFLNSIK